MVDLISIITHLSAELDNDAQNPHTADALAASLRGIIRRNTKPGQTSAAALVHAIDLANGNHLSLARDFMRVAVTAMELEQRAA